jgi:hypothetical protein
MDTSSDITYENHGNQGTEWMCRRCHHLPSTKGNLLSHLRRKQPCETKHDKISIEDYIKELTTKIYEGKVYICSYCDAKFTTRQAKYKHKFTCKAVTINDDDPNKKIANLEEQNKILQSRIESLEMRVNETTNRQENIQTSNNQIINNQVINNNQININVNINNFGSENTSYLTHEFLSYCIQNPRKGMTSLIENIHYNSDYPENQNIRCKSLKQNVFEKYVNEQWRQCDASNTLDELIRKGYRILNAHYTDNIANDPEIYEDEIKQRVYEKFRFLSDTNCNDYYAVKRELRILVKDRTMYLIASPENEN